MPGQKYVVATAENLMQITVRNILNPSGYMFLGNCSDLATLIRMVRTYQPDFVIIDCNMNAAETISALETIDSEMLCACIIIDDCREDIFSELLPDMRITVSCVKPLSREVFLNTVNLALMTYKRIVDIERKLRTMTENYETRKQVERAKWILMERDGLTEPQAYERIRKRSMDTRTSIRMVAESIIMAHSLDELDGSDVPDTPDTPDGSDVPDTPDVPDVPDVPDAPDTPDGSDAPDVPDVPDAPDTPDGSDAPDTPDSPDTPDVPDAPDEPDTPDTPDGSDVPDKSDTLKKLES